MTALVCSVCVFNSCQKEAAVLPAGPIKITVSDVAADAFTFTLAPYAACESYSYLVVEGKALEVAADSLYNGQLDGVAKGSFKYSTDKQANVTVSSLGTGVTYTVFAVCGNADGEIADVARETVTTTDVQNPSLVSFTNNGASVDLVFSEPMAYVAGKEVTAVPYCKMFLTGNPAGAAVKGEVFAVFDNTVSVKFPDIKTPGTYYLVNYEAGTFTDLSGNPCEAVSSKFTSAVAADGSCGCEGVYGALPNGELVYTIQNIKEVDAVNYSTMKISVNVPAGVNRVDLVDTYKTVVTHKDGKKDEYPMSRITHFSGTYYDLVMQFAGEAAKGDKVSIVIPAGAIQDWYGNVNSKAITVGPYNVVSSAPEIKSFSSEGNLLTIVFDEDIKYVPGKNVSATPYCKVYIPGNPAAGASNGEIVEIYGTKATIKFPFTTPGTYYTVNFEQGTFTDMNGYPCNALTSTFTSAVTADGVCGCNGVFGWLPNGELSYKLPTATTISIADFNKKSFSVNVPAGITRVDLVDGYKTVIEHADGTKDEVAMAKVTNYYGSYYDVVVIFAGTAVVGDKASVVIPAGAVQDWYGNVNSKDIVFGPVTVVE